jgi:hypothetical protein
VEAEDNVKDFGLVGDVKGDLYSDLGVVHFDLLNYKESVRYEEMAIEVRQTKESIRMG